MRCDYADCGCIFVYCYRKSAKLGCQPACNSSPPRRHIPMDATTTPTTQVATVKLLIGGKFIESKTTEWRDIVNPATQEVLAKVPFATPAEVDAAVASAKEAFKT